jgi:hypothetical protein
MFSYRCWLLSGCLILPGFVWAVPDAAQAEPDPGLPAAAEGQLAQQDDDESDAADGDASAGPAPAPAATDQKISFGPFTLDGGLTVSQGYTDNVYATRNDKIGDGIVVIVPELSLGLREGPLELELFGNAEIGRHWDETSEDYEDFDFGLDATYRITPQNVVFGGASFGRDHEERDSPDAVNGTEPTLYYNPQAYVGTINRFDRFSVRAGGTFERLDYKDVGALGGTINNDDRDRNLYTAGARVGYMVSPGYEVFGQGLYDLRDYDSSRDDFGFDRDSDGFSAALGLRYRPDRTLDVEGFVGYLGQYYDDPDLTKITSPDFGLRLEWRPRPATRITGFVDRSVQETTTQNASGYLSTGAGLSVSQQVRRDLTFETSVAYYQDDYKGIDRNDDVLDLGIGARYYLTPNFFLGTNYSFLQRDSSAPEDDYDEHQVYFSLGAELSPAYNAELPDQGPPIMSDLGGLYGGLQGSLTQLGTALEGPRGAGGSLTGEFADHGLGGGVFLGYGLRAGDWHFGLEVDAELSSAKWHHSREPGGRIFSTEKEYSVSLGPLIGYWLNDDSMIYTRFGIVQSQFDTDYIQAGNRLDETNNQTGLRFGLGGETTLVDNFFVRLDYSYTSYEDFNIAASSGNDNFANNESTVRLGIGYRFPGGAKNNEEPATETPIDLAGFYAGAGGGHNTLTSENTGDRDAGSVLKAEAGEGGASGGLFAGYGFVWNDIYLGGEVEGELSNASWDRKRQPTGRTFVIDKEGGVGAALRLGYVLPGGALAYGRAGVMYSKFHTEMTSAGSRFEEDEWLVGVRLGVGLELPISESFFARLEYSYTEYEDASLATGSGPEDFEHSEGLFRAAIGFRF